MTDAVEIRRGTADDFPAVLQLWQEMMQYHHGRDPRFQIAANGEEAYLGYLNDVVENFDFNLLVAARKEQVVGYTIAAIMVNHAILALPQYGFIAEMAVTESERGQGTGERLWKAAVDWFRRRGTTVVQLNVSPKNEKGQRFWRRLGCDDFLDILWYDIPRKAT